MTSKLDHYAAQLAALGNPIRLAAVRAIVQGESEGTAVGDLQSKLGIPWSTLSRHLDKLASAGLVRSRPDGKYVFYRAHYGALRALTDYLWEDCCKGGAGSCC